MAKQQTRQEWTKRIERWKDSGLTAAEFATETGISAKSLSWWRWNLSAEAKAHGGSKPETTEQPSLESTELGLAKPAVIERAPVKRRRRRSKAAAMMTFVEMTPPQPRESLEVVVASGRFVRVPIGFDAPTFERLLRLLEQRA